MVCTINEIIFGNLREGKLFYFESIKVELIVNNWVGGIRTIRRAQNERIDVSLYDVFSNSDMDKEEDRRTFSIHPNSTNYISPLDSRYQSYKSELMRTKQW